VSVEELYRGWREKHPDLSYGEKRWFRPGEYVSEQVSYGEIMDSISDHVVEVEGEYDPYKVRGVFETALVECSRRAS